MKAYGKKFATTAARTFAAGVGSTTVIAAPGAGKEYWVHRIIITFGTHSSTGQFSITDGTDALVGPMVNQFVDGFTINYGEPGRKWGSNKGIVLTTATTAIGARVTVVGRIVG
jgi:hypothetical protein